MSGQPATLSLIVTPPAAPTPRGGTCPIVLRLANIGRQPQVVNQRLSLGYRDLPARELFAELTGPTHGEPANYRLARYNRDDAPASAFVPLAPGQVIERTLDLFEFYRPREPGQYSLQLYYQGDVQAHAPVDVARGIVIADAVQLMVT